MCQSCGFQSSVIKHSNLLGYHHVTAQMVPHVSKKNTTFSFKGSEYTPEDQNPGYPTIFKTRKNLGQDHTKSYLPLIPSSKN